jgi:transcriptional regulator with XRE-family HTH domain
MSERSKLIAKLNSSVESRASYIRGKISVLIPAQLRAIRLKHPLKQLELAEAAGMKQSRISAMERPGAANFNVETLIRTAAALRVGLEIRFVPFSKMLDSENDFNQDEFDVVRLERDRRFLNPPNEFLTPVAVDAGYYLDNQSFTIQPLLGSAALMDLQT